MSHLINIYIVSKFSCFFSGTYRVKICIFKTCKNILDAVMPIFYFLLRVKPKFDGISYCVEDRRFQFVKGFSELQH